MFTGRKHGCPKELLSGNNGTHTHPTECCIWTTKVDGISMWRRGVVLMTLGISSKILCVRPGTGMGDRLRRSNHLRISPSYPGQLSLLPSAGRKM